MRGGKGKLNAEGKARATVAGAMKVIENAADNKRQLSKEWIEAVANKLSKEEKDFLIETVKNKKIRTAVTGINKETGDILFLPIEVKNKARRK